MKKRLFLAIEIPPSLKRKIAELQEELKTAGIRASWTNPTNIHLTLIFFGDLDYTLIPEICEALSQIKLKSIQVACSYLGGFPDLVKPHTLWIGIKENKDLNQLEKKISKILQSANLVFDNSKEFRPHLTFARFKNVRNIQELLEKIPDKDFPCFSVKEMVLFESELSKEGPIYKPVKVFTINE